MPISIGDNRAEAYRNIDATRPEDSWDDLLQQIDSAEQATPPEGPVELAGPEKPEEQVKEEKGKLRRALDAFTFFVRPLGAPSAALLAPLARDSGPDEDIITMVKKDWKVSRDAFVDELHPEYGETPPSHGADVVRRVLDFADAHPWAQLHPAILGAKNLERAYGRDVASHAYGFGLEVASDPLNAAGGAVMKGTKVGLKMLEAGKGIVRKGSAKAPVLSQGISKILRGGGADLTSHDATTAMRLARQAEAGSRRAAGKLNSFMQKKFPDVMTKFEVKSLKRQTDALGFYHVPVTNKAGQVVTNSLGQPVMLRRPPPRAAIAKEIALDRQRKAGSARLLMRELNGRIMSSPYRYRRSYLDINTPKDVDKLIQGYMADAGVYVRKAYGRLSDGGRKAADDMLSTQVEMLEREIGDTVKLNVNPIEAFGIRIMLRDLGQGIRATIAAGGSTTAEAAGELGRGFASGYKYQGLIDHLRFWKLVLARESLRSTLSGSKLNATGAFARINTRAPGASPGVKLLQVSRAKDALPKPAPHQVQLIASQLSRLEGSQAANTYLNKIFSPGGMKLEGQVSPEAFTVLNRTLKTEEALFGAYMDALLSNPVTHFRNIVDTGSLMLFQDVKEFVSAIPAAARTSPDTLMHVQSGMARMHGHLEAIGDMFRVWAKEAPRRVGSVDDFRDMHEVMMSRSRPQLGPMALRNASNLSRMVDWLNHMRPTAFLGKADAALKSIEFRAALRSEALKTAHQMGGGKLSRTRKLYEAAVDNPLESMKVTAFGSAEKYTYQQPFNPNSWFEKEVLQRLSGVPFVRFVTPFVRTPYQILKRGLEDGPLSVAHSSTWRDIAAGGAARDSALAKVMITAGGVAYLALNTNEQTLTGGVPGVQNARGQWLLENQYHPYSAGDKHSRWSFENLGPLRWIAGTAANLRDLAYFTDWDSLDGPDKVDRAITGAVTSLVEPMSNSFFLEGFTRLIDTMASANSPGFTRKLERLSQDIVRGFAAPGISRATKDLWDTQAREATTFLEKIMAATPGLSDTLPPKTDILGHPISQSYWSKFSPLDLDPKNTSDVAQELRRVNARLTDIPKDFQGLVKFTTAERSQIRQLRDKGFRGSKGLEAELREKMRTKLYRDSTKQEKADILSAMVSAYSSAAMLHFIQGSSAVQNRIKQAEQAELEARERADR